MNFLRLGIAITLSYMILRGEAFEDRAIIRTTALGVACLLVSNNIMDKHSTKGKK